MSQINVNKIISEIEDRLDRRDESFQQLQKLFEQKGVSQDLYNLLHLAKLKKKLYRYKFQRNVWYAKIVNTILSIIYTIIFRALDPVFSSQEMFNRQFLQELIKLKNK